MRLLCPDHFVLVPILQSGSQLSCPGLHILQQFRGELAGVTVGNRGRRYFLLPLLLDMLCGWDPVVLFEKEVGLLGLTAVRGDYPLSQGSTTGSYGFLFWLLVGRALSFRRRCFRLWTFPFRCEELLLG